MARVSTQQLQLELAQLRGEVSRLKADAEAPSTVYRKRRTYAECETDAERAAYRAQFRRAKQRKKLAQSARVPRPEGESPTVLDFLKKVAKTIGCSHTDLRIQSGAVWRGKEYVMAVIE